MIKNFHPIQKKNNKNRQKHLVDLRVKIIRLGLRYNQVAKMIGVSPAHLSLVLRGKTSKRVIEYLEKL